MGFLKEFKAFALKGNVMDMAVGVIIGGAFGKIVTSLVNDVIMPPIGLVVGPRYMIRRLSDLQQYLQSFFPSARRWHPSFRLCRQQRLAVSP